MNTDNEIKPKKQILLRAILFVIIIAFIFIVLGWFFLPRFDLDTNFYGKRAFNDQPRNSVETIILGSSAVYTGVTPMEMYENNGISVWTLGSSHQPLASSYYLLEESYKLHPETLHIVMIDPLQLTYQTNTAMRRMITDAMKYFDIKLAANIDYTDSIADAFSYSLPLISYHSRWAEISNKDFGKIGEYRPYLRGYYLYTSRDDFESLEFSEMEVPEYVLDASAGEKQLDTEGLYYFRKIIDFCDEHGLKLVLIKTPMSMHWDSEDHNAVQRIADKYSLDFIDFNYDPLFSEIGLNYATDLKDTDHLNYYGVRKLTAWLGKYLVDEYGATDVRGKPGYEYLDKDLAEYKEKLAGLVELMDEQDPAGYLSKALKHDDYSVFITVKEDAGTNLTQDQRMKFSKLGLPALSMLGIMDSYLAVIDPLKGLVYEDTEKDPGKTETNDGTVDNVDVMEKTSIEDIRQNRPEEEEEQIDEEEAIKFEGNLADGGYYNVMSGGENLGDVSSCKINNIEYSQRSDGINIVIYDNTLGEVVDSTVFNTGTYPVRMGNDLESELKIAIENGIEYEDMPEKLQKLMLYNARCEEVRNAVLSGDNSDEDTN